MRELAARILRYADSIDQDWSPEAVKSSYGMFSRAARIERDAIGLAQQAILEEMRSMAREDAIGTEFVGIPAWNMLLELFRQFAGGARVSTKSLQIISRCPETTALRIIDRLEKQGLVERSVSHDDKRFTFVTLTRDGLIKVGSVLKRFKG